jgi:hypothetical protein
MIKLLKLTRLVFETRPQSLTRSGPKQAREAGTPTEARPKQAKEAESNHPHGGRMGAESKHKNPTPHSSACGLMP